MKYVIPITPIAKARPRKGRNGFYTPKKTSIYENSLHALLKNIYKGEFYEEPARMEIVFKIPRPKSVKRPYPSVKPDLDNFIKSFLDACNGLIFKDDALICELITRKEYDTVGSIIFSISKI